MNNNDIQTTIQNIRKFFEIEVINKDDNLTKFSEDVITTAYQKLCQSLEDVIQNEDDPMVINELLSSFLNTEKMINDRNVNKNQLLLKLLDQLTKYEQSRYY